MFVFFYFYSYFGDGMDQFGGRVVVKTFGRASRGEGGFLGCFGAFEGEKCSRKNLLLTV